VGGTFSGNLSKVKEYGVKFSTSNNFPSDATTTLTFEGTPGNSVTANLSGLSPSTHYYYCWYATTGNIVVRSEYGEFTTTATAKPQFSELEVDSIGENYVRLRCRVTEIGDQYLVEQGVSYRAKSNAAASFIPVTAESIDGNNEFTVAIEDLTAATTYEVRPYAKNSADAEGESGMLEGYGETQTFTTDDKLSPELETYDATDVTMNSARVLAKVTAAEGSYGVLPEPHHLRQDGDRGGPHPGRGVRGHPHRPGAAHHLLCAPLRQEPGELDGACGLRHGHRVHHRALRLAASQPHRSG
jgi:hypothetical protein